jgi:hypothetical protein
MTSRIMYQGRDSNLEAGVRSLSFKSINKENWMIPLSNVSQLEREEMIKTSRPIICSM